jgi:hypothetical protein
MDGRIAHLVCIATVVAGENEPMQSAALAEGVLRMELPRELPAALERVLADDPTVYVARSLHCEVRARPAVTGEALARSIAAQLACAVRDPARDGPDLVRFASAADYLAAFLAALVRGDAWRRWYFSPLRRVAHLDTPAVFLALAAEGNDMAHVLLALRRTGQLGPVVSAVGEDALAQAWPSSRYARPRQAEWRSLVRLAVDLASALGWDIIAGQDLQAAAAMLAESAGEDLDWTDSAGLARALARAARLVSAPAPVSAGQLPGWLDWADTDALVRGLSALPQPAPRRDTPAGTPVTAVRPPRTLAIEAALSRLVSSAGPVLDPRSPTMASVVLWAALAEEMPELAGVAWARDAVRRFVDQRLARHATPPGGTAATAGADQYPAAARVPCAGIYLLLRTLDAMRMPRLCRRAGVPAVLLLQALAYRWAGPVDVTEALLPVAGNIASRHASLTGETLRLLQAEVTRIALAQRQEADEVVPVAASEPACRPEYLPGDADDPGRATLLADLAAMAHAHAGDPEIDLPLDLIALTVLRHWAQWLRGFGTASAPYLLSTFIRRPGELAAADGGPLRVSLARLPHDVVLDVSGCLDAFELQWPWVSGLARRVEFTLGT